MVSQLNVLADLSSTDRLQYLRGKFVRESDRMAHSILNALALRQSATQHTMSPIHAQ